MFIITSASLFYFLYDRISLGLIFWRQRKLKNSLYGAIIDNFKTLKRKLRGFVLKLIIGKFLEQVYLGKLKSMKKRLRLIGVVFVENIIGSLLRFYRKKDILLKKFNGFEDLV